MELIIQRLQASNGIRLQAETSGCDSHPDSSVGHDVCCCIRPTSNLVYRLRYRECFRRLREFQVADPPRSSISRIYG